MYSVICALKLYVPTKCAFLFFTYIYIYVAIIYIVKYIGRLSKFDQKMIKNKVTTYAFILLPQTYKYNI
jgi:hypothetical protein